MHRTSFHDFLDKFLSTFDGNFVHSCFVGNLKYKIFQNQYCKNVNCKQHADHQINFPKT